MTGQCDPRLLRHPFYKIQPPQTVSSRGRGTIVYNPLSIWLDIPPINPRAKERLGYPTQKPLALLERIIRASSNPDDIVLDPFCGCATTCVAADRLGRQWVGIDLSPLAARLVRSRLQAEGPLLYDLNHLQTFPGAPT